MKLQRRQQADGPHCDSADGAVASPTQRDLYLAQERAPEDTTYSLGVTVELPSMVSSEVWAEAMAPVAAAEPALGARFGLDADGAVRSWPTGSPAPHLRALAHASETLPFVQRRYDLREGRLYAAALLETGPDERAMAVVAAHHIVLDAPGAVLLVRRAWDALHCGAADSPVPGPAFDDYARAAHAAFDTPQVEQDLRERLGGASALVASAPSADAPPMTARATLRGVAEMPEWVIAARVLALYARALALQLAPQAPFVLHEVFGARKGPYREVVGCMYGVIPVVFAAPLPSDPGRWVAQAERARALAATSRNASVALQRRIGPAEGIRFHFNLYDFDRPTIGGRPCEVEVIDSFPHDEVHLIARPRADGVALDLHHRGHGFGAERLLADIVSGHERA